MTEREELVAFLRDEAGSSLRAVLRYYDGAHETLYQREDLTDADGMDEATVAAFRDAELADERQAGTLAVGNHHATLRLFDSAIVIHFPQDQSVGTVISLDTTVARDVAQFVGACLRDLHRDSPQRIESAPEW